MLLCVFGLFALPRLLISRFSFVKQPPSVEITRGVFLSPETFPRKIFPKIFSKHPKRLFADFLARICDEGKGCLLPAYGGGTPFFVGLWASVPRLILQHREHLNPSGRLGLLCSSFCWVVLLVVGFRSSVLPDSLGLPEDLTTGRKTAQNRPKRGKTKVFFGVRWCFLGIFGHSKGAKQRYF